ncbi:MAG: cobamide remodeling phosphodiesterase CbiR, partial [Acidobacteriota bacterium]
LGTTSYIYPGEILPNAELLSDIFEEIQLLLFESESHSNIPDQSTIDRLNQLGSEKKLHYSIHLPLDTYPGHENEEIRRESVRTIVRIYEIGRAVQCERFVFHYTSRNPEGKPFSGLTGWREQLLKSTEELVAAGIKPNHLCVENLAYPYSWVSDLVERYGLSKCIDIGHLRVNSFPVSAHLKRHLRETKVIHLHGLNKGVDHCGLSKSDSRSIRQLFAKVDEFGYHETIILEVFHPDHLVQSLQTFVHYWKKCQKEKLL